MTGLPEVARFRLQDQSTGSYTVEGLESLAYLGQLDPETLIAREGTSDFRPVRSWEFAGTVCPPKKILTFTKSTEETAIVPACFSLAFVPPRPGTHIISMEEIKALIRRDPHDPRVLVLLNGLKERMHAEGITVEQAFADFFAGNVALNQKLTLKVIYRYVSDTVKMHRLSALGAGILANALLGSAIFFSDDSFDRQCALASAMVVTGLLCFFATYAYHIDRWLNVHPVLAGLLLIFTIFAGLTIVEMGMTYNSDISLWQNLWKFIGPT